MDRGGFLFSYVYDTAAVYRRGAWYVARILGGAQPGDLPIERASKFELVVNRTKLQDLGLTLPENVALQVAEFVA